MQGGHPVRVFGSEDFRDGATHVAAGQRVPRVSELVQRGGDDPGNLMGRHAGGGERGREREARQRRDHDVQIRQQRQNPLEPQHRVRPAVQQHDDRGVGVPWGANRRWEGLTCRVCPFFST